MAHTPGEMMSIDFERVRKPVRKLRRFLKKPPKEPTADRIHHLRTSARRFETAVEALDHQHSSRQKRLLKDLSRLRRRAGKVRDMDVLISKVATLEIEGEQQCQIALLNALGKTRSGQLKKLLALVEKKGERLRRGMGKEVAKVGRGLEPSRSADAGSCSASNSLELASQALRLTRMLKTPEQLTRRNLHSYRVKVRELAYLLQMANAEEQRSFVKKLLQVKDAIGEWHDWGVLLEIAVEVLDHGKQCRLLKSLRIITAGKYSQALQVTTGMRNSFLKPAAIRAQLLGSAQHDKSRNNPTKRPTTKEQEAAVFPVEKHWLRRSTQHN